MMKKECRIVGDVLPVYLENCSRCAAEFEYLKLGKQVDEARALQRKHDAEVIKAINKKIAKRTFKAVAILCLVFDFLFNAVLLYASIHYPVTKYNISLSAKTDRGYTYIILETVVGKSLHFERPQ